MSECKICTKKMNIEEEIKYNELFMIKVCDSCAGRVKEAYDNWHGGCYVPTKKSDAERARKVLSTKVRLAVYKRDGFKCVRCGCSDLTIDHIIPIAKGGTNEDNNLQTLCRSCNSKKGTKDNEDWQ